MGDHSERLKGFRSGDSPKRKTHWQIHVAVAFAQGFHDLREAVVDRDVQGRAAGGVQKIRVGAFADQEPGDVRLVSGSRKSASGKDTKGGEEKRTRNKILLLLHSFLCLFF